MHPIERMRFVARATGAPVDDIVSEAAASLASFAADPISLVTACRRLIDRHPANGPIWWLCARTLVAPDPADEPWRCQSEHHADPTVDELTHALPDEACVAVVGWPDRLTSAFVRRGDVGVRVLDIDGDGPGYVRHLERLGVPADDVAVSGLAAAVASADVVLVDATAIGPSVALAASGSWQAAAVARSCAVPVWLVGGRGRTLPASLWPALVARLGAPAVPAWQEDHDRLPLALVDRIAGPRGLWSVAETLATVDTPDAAELRR